MRMLRLISTLLGFSDLFTNHEYSSATLSCIGCIEVLSRWAVCFSTARRSKSVFLLHGVDSVFVSFYHSFLVFQSSFSRRSGQYWICILMITDTI